MNRVVFCGVVMTVLIVAVMLSAMGALAQNPPATTTPSAQTSNGPKTLEELDPLSGATFYTIIQRVISLFLGMVGALALGVFVYAGITWMTAGSSDRVQKAKDAMKYAVIGLAMIGFSYAVTTFFIDALTGRIAGQVQQAQQQQPSNFATPPPVNP